MRNSKDIVEDIFKLIDEAKTVEQIKDIHNVYKIKTEGEIDLGAGFPNDNYPRIKFSLTSDDIELMKSRGLINENGMIDSSITSRDDLTPLEKLLYSVLWKNGDLKKERHIVNGVLSQEVGAEEPNGGLVFYYFGKHLTDKKSPIIDQHVLRAYMLYKCKNQNDFDNICRKKTVNLTDIDECKCYLNWHQNLLREKEFKDDLKQVELTYHLDRLLFGLGKFIKVN